MSRSVLGGNLQRRARPEAIGGVVGFGEAGRVGAVGMIGLGELGGVAACVGVDRAAIAQLLVAQHRLAGVEILHDPLGVGELQRPHVLAVDRRHGPDVTGAQALERADVDVLALRGRGHRVENLLAPRIEQEMFVHTNTS